MERREGYHQCFTKTYEILIREELNFRVSSLGRSTYYISTGISTLDHRHTAITRSCQVLLFSTSLVNYTRPVYKKYLKKTQDISPGQSSTQPHSKRNQYFKTLPRIHTHFIFSRRPHSSAETRRHYTLVYVSSA